MHEHNHGCACGQDLDHDACGHEHGCTCADCAGGDTARFRLTHAEGATAAAVRFSVPGPQGTAEVYLAGQIKALAADIQAAGGLVGHIKAALTGAPEVSTFSCTGGAVTIGRRTESGACTAELVAIVLGLDDASIQAAVRKCFPEIDRPV